MNKPMIIASAALTATVVVATTLAMNSYHQDLYERYPNLDRKIIRKAYNRLLRDAFTQTVDVAHLTDMQMDLLFMNYYVKAIVK